MPGSAMNSSFSAVLMEIGNVISLRDSVDSGKDSAGTAGAVMISAGTDTDISFLSWFLPRKNPKVNAPKTMVITSNVEILGFLIGIILRIDGRRKSCYNIHRIIHDFLSPDKSGIP